MYDYVFDGSIQFIEIFLLHCILLVVCRPGMFKWEQFALSDIFPGNVVQVLAAIQGRIEDKPTPVVVEIRSAEDTAVELAAVVLVV